MTKQFLGIFLVFTLLLGSSCAKRGTITGGYKDTLAPVLKVSYPKNFTTNFNAKEIRLVFDEYVKLKNANKQLVISPPLKNQPEILPYTASREITIKIKDTLLPNTTYSLNFGQSIEDNNEGNPYSQFRYVFSTGNVIDSLKLTVAIKDALEKKTDNFVSVMLYEVNEKYNDSTIYKEPPRYIANTLDSLQVVTLQNIKEGKYLLVALKDNGNNKFDPKSDKIGFQKNYISIPNDTVFEVELFKEILPFKALKPSQVSGNRMVFGYEGNTKGVKVTVKNGATEIPSIVTQFPKKDSLQVWYSPIKADSLLVTVEKEKYRHEYWTKISNQKKDTLKIMNDKNGVIGFRERFSFSSSIPLTQWDTSKMVLRNKDSVAVDFSVSYDEFQQKVWVDFKKEPSEKYILTAYPGAMTDFFSHQNDTITARLSTKNYTDYGNLKVILENVKRYPILVELTDKEGKVEASAVAENNPVVEFFALEPNKYTLRVIYDDNKNGIWDTGSFIQKQETEEVIYFPKEIDVRANWDVEQPFVLPK